MWINISYGTFAVKQIWLNGKGILCLLESQLGINWKLSIMLQYIVLLLTYWYSARKVLYLQTNDLIMDFRLSSKLSNNEFGYQMSCKYISLKMNLYADKNVYALKYLKTIINTFYSYFYWDPIALIPFSVQLNYSSSTTLYLKVFTFLYFFCWLVLILLWFI